jgi:peptide deformylase
MDTMLAGPGVGLAAPQIGILKQVSVIDVSLRKNNKPKKGESNHGRIILINPHLVCGEGQQIPREGCLSVPDVLANIKRFQKVSVTFQRPNGEQETIHAEGFEALALQHEMDHLNGTLFLDRVESLKTDVFRRMKI